MLDIAYIKENIEELKRNISNRQADPKIVGILVEKERERSEIKKGLEEAQRKRNENADKLQGIKDKKSEEAVKLIEKGKRIKEEIQNQEDSYRIVDAEYMDLMYQIPNITDPDMPVGKSSKDNVEIKVGGKRKEFDFKPKDHVELGKLLDIIDVERSAKVSGSRFGYLKNEAVLLEIALINHLTKKLVKRGFMPIIPPILVKEAAMYGTGYFPMERTQAYQLANENVEEGNNLFLAGTGEVPTVSYHAGEILNEKDLPLKYFAISPCFRSEVGSWGKDVRGIKRVHQFDKLEMVVFSKPEESSKFIDYLLEINEELLTELELPYHVLNMNTGDVGYATYKKYDVEVFIPSQDEYCETMSTSNIHAYQARRLNIRYRKADGSIDFVHTLNSTGAAMGRIILSIIENYQQKDGSVKIPEVLLPYLKDIIDDIYIRP